MLQHCEKFGSRDLCSNMQVLQKSEREKPNTETESHPNQCSNMHVHLMTSE